MLTYYYFIYYFFQILGTAYIIENWENQYKQNTFFKSQYNKFTNTIYQKLQILIQKVKTEISRMFERSNINYACKDPSALAIKQIKNMLNRQKKLKNDVLQPEETINYRISLMWKQELKQREIIAGKIKAKKDMSQTQIQEAIWKQFQKQNKCFKKGSILLVRLQSETQIVVQTKDKPQNQREILKLGRPIIQGLLIEQKINLPAGYSYLPSKFVGPTVQNLSISNKYGTISWNSPVDTTGIDFSEGIEIMRDQIQICSEDTYRSLHTDVLVQFNQLPQPLLKYRQKYGDMKIQCKLRKCVNKDGCRLVSYVPVTGHWFIHIILSKTIKN